MTVSNTINKHTYSGNGVTTQFPYTFALTDPDHIHVYLTNASGVVSEITADFYVNDADGYVEYPGYETGTEPPAEEQPDVLPTGWKITIVREVPLTQEIDLVNSGSYQPETMEGGYDKLTQICQQLSEQIDRSVQLPIDSAAGAGELLITTIQGYVAAASASASSASVSESAAAQSVVDAAAQVSLAEDQVGLAAGLATDAEESAIAAAASAASVNMPSITGNGGKYLKANADETGLEYGTVNLTIDANPTDGSSNAVSSNGVFDALALKEASLGNPASDGMVLTSTTGGARSWITQSGGEPGIGNHTINDLSVTPGTGLQAVVGTGRAWISDALTQLTGTVTQTLLKRRAQLLYLKNDKTTGVISCQYPAYNDANTVVRYDMNHLNGQWIESTYYPLNATVNENSTYYKVTTAGVSGTSAPTWPGSGTVSDGTVVWTQQAGAGTIVPNSASAGVANDLSVSGTVSQVDGRRGYARQGNGSTGYMRCANATGIPAYNAVIEETAHFRYYPTVSDKQSLYEDGSRTICINTSSYLEIRNSSGVNVSTDYLFETGKDYVLTVQYTGSTHNVFVNAQLVYTGLTPYSATIVAPYIGFDGGSRYSKSILYYLDIRNALRTPTQIATIAQQMLIPCAYTNVRISSFNTNMATRTDTIFDGTIAQTGETGAYGSNVAYGRIGGLFGAPIGMKSVKVYGSTNYGFSFDNSHNVSMTITLVGYNGSTYTDIASQTLTNSGSYWSTTQPVVTFSYPAGTYIGWGVRIALTSGSNCWPCVAEMVFEPQASLPTDIRSVLPADSMVVGYTETSATAPTLIIDGSNPSGSTPDWAYGIRVGPRGDRNKRKKLGYKYFSGATVVSFTNPVAIFGTYDYGVRFFYLPSINLPSVEIRPTADVNGFRGAFIVDNKTSSIAINTYASTSLGKYNGTEITSGYLNIVAEILDGEAY
jgi:hypothetical protein